MSQFQPTVLSNHSAPVNALLHGAKYVTDTELCGAFELAPNLT